MKRVRLTLAVLAALGAVAGASVVLGGLYNVSARAGHWPVTTWVLHTTFRNSVRLRAPEAEAVPDLRAPGLAELGAKHYETACSFCHASPGRAQTAEALAMEPPPPHIDEVVKDWDPRHLFWIVREGVKMSGMPAWPAARDDDVWAVVAFLERVEGMGAQGYDRLIAAPDTGETDAAAVDQPATGAPPELAYCARCHGRDGQSGNPEIPRLDLQGPAYRASALEAYADGRRASGVMRVAARHVDEEARAALAEWYGRQPAATTAPRLSAASPATSEAATLPAGLLARGEALAAARFEAGEAGESGAEGKSGGEDIPACIACHGPWPEPRDATFPQIAGQSARYIAAQLHLWRDGARGGGRRAHLMRQAAEHLEDADIEALAQYFARLEPARKNNETSARPAR